MQEFTINGRNITLVQGGELSLADLPDGAVALDGAVQSPVLGDDRDRWSFDHHSGCSRLVTAATCEQVQRALLLGFDSTGRDIYVNDLDADTLLSLWLLVTPAVAGNESTTLLIRAVGTIDAHGPAGNRLLSPQEQAIWRSFFSRFKDVLPRDAQAAFADWETLIREGLSELPLFLNNILDIEPTPAEPFEVHEVYLSDDNRMVMAKCDSFGGFESLYNEGFRVVCLVAKAADGSLRYTIGKVSDLVSYRLGPHNDSGSLLGRLNAREPGWGGGSSIGGSPRLNGGVSSRLSLLEVWDLMVEVYREKKVMPCC